MTIDVGEGYRLLKDGEVIQAGDEAHIFDKARATAPDPGEGYELVPAAVGKIGLGWSFIAKDEPTPWRPLAFEWTGHTTHHLSYYYRRPIKKVGPELVNDVREVNGTRYVMANHVWYQLSSPDTRKLTRLEAVAAGLEKDPYSKIERGGPYGGDSHMMDMDKLGSRLNWATDLSRPSLTIYGPDYSEDGVDV